MIYLSILATDAITDCQKKHKSTLKTKIYNLKI